MSKALQAPALADIREHFPALQSGTAFLENAGGSQITRQAIQAVTDLYTQAYVQIHAGYPQSDKAAQTYDDAHAFLNRWFNGEGIGQTVIGASATELLHRLANCFRQTIRPGDEIVLSVANHEANINPWLLVAKETGATVRWWPVHPKTGMSSLDELAAVLNDKTRIVAFHHTSNLVGDIIDARAVARMARAVGAASVVDCVASAPHQALDTKTWEVDFAVFSLYKTFGPHLSALWGRDERWARFSGPNHPQLPRTSPKAFELGCLPYELLAAANALAPYLAFLAGERSPATPQDISRQTIENAFAIIQALEEPLERQFLDFLLTKPSVRILGLTAAGENRHPTFSFVSTKTPPDLIAANVNATGQVAIRNGNMYAWRLCEALSIPPEPGVVRVSAVHYNTPEEITRLCELLDPLV